MRRCKGYQVFVDGDGLMQPLPSLMQSVQSDPKTQTVNHRPQHSSLYCQVEVEKTNEQIDKHKLTQTTRIIS